MDIDLRFGDAIEQMKSIPDNSISAVITDPPYGTTACKWDNVIPFKPMWNELNRISKKQTAILLFGSEPFSSFLRMSNIRNYKYDWIWEKSTATGHLNAKKRPMKANELISVFYTKQPIYNPQKTTGHNRKISSSSHKRNSKKTDVYRNHGLTSYDSTERYPRTVLKYKTDKQKEAYHPTQKPLALLEYLVKTYTNEGDTVLDFTMGSGTTAIACMNLSRKFIGIELDEGYFQIAKKRVEENREMLRQTTLF